MTQCSHLELLQMEPEGALSLSTQQHGAQYLKEKQEDMRESSTGKAEHTHTIYIPASLQAFLFSGNSFQQHFLLFTVAWPELCHLTTFSLLFQTTKHFIFPFSSKNWKTSCSHSVSRIGMEIPQHNAVLRKDMQGCRGKSYSFLESWCVLLSP